MDESELGSLSALSSPSASSVSRPIPIQRNRSDRSGSSSGTPSPNFAQSAPAPRAPVIGSLRAPSVLGSNMPRLELPPQSPAGRSVGVGANYAQSAPSDHYLLSSKKPILHALQLRERSDSTTSSGSVGKRVRMSSSLGRSGAGLSNRLDTDREPIYELREEEEADVSKLVSVDDDADSARVNSESAKENLDEMTVFKTIKSMSQTDGFKPLSSQMDALDLGSNADAVRDSEHAIKASTTMGDGDKEDDGGVEHAALAAATTSLLSAQQDQSLSEKPAELDDDSGGEDFEEQFDMDDGA